jgi:hypothetical protein
MCRLRFAECPWCVNEFKALPLNSRRFFQADEGAGKGRQTSAEKMRSATNTHFAVTFAPGEKGFDTPMPCAETGLPPGHPGVAGGCAAHARNVSSTGTLPARPAPTGRCRCQARGRTRTLPRKNKTGVNTGEKFARARRFIRAHCSPEK